MKKFLSFMMCVIMVFSALTLTGCKDKNAVGQEWEAKTYATDAGVAVDYKVGFKVTRESSKIKEVWLNVKEIKGENVRFSFAKYKSGELDGESTDLLIDGNLLNNGPTIITSAQVKEANKTAKGWIKLNATDWNLSYDSVLMSMPGNVTLREIVFVGTNGKVLSTEIYKAYMTLEYKVDKRKTDHRIKEFTAAELLTYAETTVYGIPQFLLDNQEAFASKDA